LASPPQVSPGAEAGVKQIDCRAESFTLHGAGVCSLSHARGLAMHNVLTFILGGGRGARLFPLTKYRSEPAVPIAGKYRLIDFPISNCINSGLMKIYVLTQYSSASLHRHISNTYKFSPFSQGFVSVLAAQQTNEASDWYRGTADAIRQNVRYIQEDSCHDVLILSGDQFYCMDFSELLQTHRASPAGVTMAVLPVDRDRATQLGIVRVDDHLRVTQLVEKPRDPGQLNALRTPPDWLAARGFTAHGRDYLANMGIYLFRRDTLLGLFQAQPRTVDIVTELLTGAGVQAHLFRGYWEDVGSIASYHRASLALACDEPPFDFHAGDNVIYTRMRDLPASRISAARLDHCHISDGCLVQPGAVLEKCVLGVRSRIGQDVRMREVVMLGANYFEEHRPDQRPRNPAVPAIGVGDRSVLERCILDKNCRIGRDVRIVNRGGTQHADADNYVIREGIVVLPNGAVVPDGAVI
jgi:glucose-1-phosphate adenylyltransferase